MSTTKKLAVRAGRNLIVSAISSLKPKRTNWRVLGYDGLNASFGTNGIKAQVGASVNALRVQQPGSSVDWIYCTGIDVSIGVSSSPINADASIPSTPAIPGVAPALQSPNMPPPPGITPGVYSLPASLGSISAKSFRGGFVTYNFGGSLLATYNLNVLFMGAAVSAILPSSPNPVLQIGKFIQYVSTCEAMVVVTGFSLSLPDLSVTGTVGVAV